MRKLIQLSTCLIFLIALNVHAQTQTPPPEEMSLEDELTNSLDGGSTAPVPLEDTSLEDEMSLSEEDPAGGLISPVAPPLEEAELTQPPSPEGEESESERVRTLEPRYLINGFAMGVEVWQHRYNIKGSLYVAAGGPEQEVDISSDSADFQSIGIKGRYAILPYGALGADMNVTLGTSLNHGSNSFAAIHTARGEFNLAYTFDMGGSGGFYLLGGLGYEILFGEDIEKLVAYGGAGTVQAGAGISFGSVGAELLYMMGFHSVNSTFMETAEKKARDQGATSVRRGSSKVTAQMIVGRLTFSF